MLRFLARFLAAVCVFAFVVGTIPIIFFQAAGTQLTGSQVYKEALTKERFYDRLPSLVADTVVHAIKASAKAGANRGVAADESLADMVHQISATDWEMMFGAIVPPSFVQQQAEHVLDQFFGWVNTPVPVVNISLGELKQRLVAPATEETYVRILQTKPPCTPAQMQSARGLPLGCCPPPGEMPRVLEAFHGMMQTAADRVPETVNLFGELSGDGATADLARRLAAVRNRIPTIQWLAWWSPAVPVVLLLLIAIFAVRSFRGWMFWWGIPCLVVGAISAALALPAVSAGKWIFSQFLVPSLPAEVPKAALDAIAGLVMAVMQSVMNAAFHTAGVLAIGGLLAVILGAVIKSRPKPAAAPAS